jgi:choline-sulfatase
MKWLKVWRGRRKMKKRNVLILMSDEHRADVTHYSGNEIIRTPVLDFLAKDGVVFSNAYTPSPICVPARQCVLAGQFPKTCDCEGWKGLSDGYPTYATQFGKYGYTSAAFGKMHMQGYDQLVGWQARPVGDVDYHPINRAKPEKNPPARVCAEDSEDSLNCPGMKKWSDTKELMKAGPGKPNYKDTLAVLGAKSWIEDSFLGTWYDRQNREKPTLLYIGLNNPHYPYICEESLFNYYLNRVPVYENQESFDHPFLKNCPWPYVSLRSGEDIPRRTAQRATAAYYALVETMDSNFKKVLDSLEEAGEDLDEWIIVYLSDHGEMLGEHGLWEKQKFFEGSARVPFIIRAPKILPKGVTIEENVNLCDLYPTLCELAGLDTPSGLDGKSLVSLMRGEDPSYSNETYSFFFNQGFCNVMVKKGDLKYQWYSQESVGILPEVLFDLERDKTETVNFIDDPIYKDEIESFRKKVIQLGYNTDENYPKEPYLGEIPWRI